MVKKVLIVFGILSVLTFIVWKYFYSNDLTDGIIIKPKYGNLIITVSSTGELQAKKSTNIRGPESARSVGIWQMSISKLIPEGTIVDSGDFVAELDKATISEKIKEKMLSVEKLNSQFLQAKLDSTLELSAARDELENLKFQLEEKKLLQEQSKYEPPATIRQVQIDYEKVLRNFEQSKKNYQTKVKKSIAIISAVSSDLQKEQQGLEKLMNTLGEFTIKAPGRGMVIYERDWEGRKRTVGSQVSSWDPTVATLPDLTLMESITYINEVDIQKVKVGQNVKLGLDADPNKKLSGKVTEVANIGEQRRNADSKVFQVNIEINEKDSTLLPAMTTGNEIVVNTIKNVLHIPLECLHSEELQKKKVSYIYKKNNGSVIKQEVETGQMNDSEIIIVKGLNKNDEVLISVPPDADKIKINRLAKKQTKNKNK
jgi:multidrug resistance efflux pump